MYNNVKILMIQQMEVRIQLAGEQTGAAGRVAEDAQQRAEAVAEEVVGGLCATTDLQFAEQATGQGVVVGAAL